MKNQYVGDVGDYGKYSLLRFLAQNDIAVGVNWYLTEDDSTNDGKHISYLGKPECREYCPEVFDVMRDIIASGDRNVKAVEDSGVIPGAVFYGDILNTTAYPWEDRMAIRNEWHSKALKKLGKVDIVFADPDNGTIGSKSASSKDAEKFTLLSEIEDFYKQGKNVVYYCQKARRNENQWEEKKNEMVGLLPEAKILVLTFRRGTRRSYIFVVHPDDYIQYRNLIEEFVKNYWKEAGEKSSFMIEDGL
ncbi:MAG: hypothetical protein J6I76_17755 [Oribacterium sp.]|nr:hypothetical protein [Oribacterium sp.]